MLRARKTVLRSWTSVTTAAVAVAATLCCGAVTARAAETTVSQDTYRTGWDQGESALSPADVSSSNFGQQFSTAVDGQVYAQPLLADGVLVVATENDKVYGLNPATGTVEWTRDFGPYWPVSTIGCSDLTPNIGVTSTPVYDPATDTVYLTTKVNDGADVAHPHWYMQAVSPTTGASKTGFPVTIGGSPSNDSTITFDPEYQGQRPGLLLLGGVVYVGFGSHCDYGGWRGYVAGVSTATAKQTALWTTATSTAVSGAGIWGGGGGLVSDGAGRIFLSTGNGTAPVPGPGTTVQGTLAESVVRLTVNGDGSLGQADFFSPANATTLDQNDTDLGSGGPMALPDAFGTTSHPHLLVQQGKDGRIFLLDRDNLGGRGQGAGGTDNVVGTVGPYQGQWGHPAFWGGDGGYVYTVDNGGPLRAFKYGTTGSGDPALTLTGASADSFPYTSGSPVVTSTGTTSGSAVVWVVYSSGPTGTAAQLRAYSAVPDAGGKLALLYSASIGTAVKFTTAATDSGRVYIGTRDGNVLAFGLPATSALTGPTTDFGSVNVGGSAGSTLTLTATKAVTISAMSTAAPFGVTPPSLPVTLATGGTIAVPLTFTPTAAGASTGILSLTTDAGTLGFSLNGTGMKPGLGAQPASLSFTSVPTGTTRTLNVQVTNTGTNTETVSATTGPAAPFSASGLPAAGTTVAAGASVVLAVTCTPTTAATDSSSITVTSTSGTLTIPLSGTAVSGQGNLVFSPATLAFGVVKVGGGATASFTVTNTGNIPVTVTKAKAPTGDFSSSSPLPEGLVIGAGEVVTQSVTYTPSAPGIESAVYLISSDSGQGAMYENLTGTGSGTLPAPGGLWTFNAAATLSGTSAQLTPAVQYAKGSAFYDTPVPTAGLTASFTVSLNGGTGADGLTFALADSTKTTAGAVGAQGGGLGFSGIPGISVDLNTYWNSQAGSGNFVAVAAGPGSGTDSLTYLAHATVPTSLRTGTHAVTVTITTAGHVQVAVDGMQLIDAVPAAGVIPATAYAGFTAGTGGATDVHTVSGVTVTTAAPTSTTLPGFNDPTWAHNGTASISGTTATMTLASQNYAAGDVVNSTAVNPLGLTATFSATISGTTATGADGMTFALFDASATTNASVGQNGGGLGIAGLPAVFVAFDTYGDFGIYNPNFCAIATSAAGSANLTALATNTSIPTLRNATNTIGISVTTAGHIVVGINGTQVMDAAVTLPPKVLVAFTGGTGSLTDTHTVTAPTITYTP
jgi:hypothetical protein